MSIPRSWWYTACSGLVAAALLPCIAHRLRGDSEDRCALDGSEITLTNAVWIRVGDEEESRFCSIHCAESWLQRSGARPEMIRVASEPAGTMIDAGSASYVRSQVVAHAPTRDRRHVFVTLEEAQRHADDHFGRVLQGDDRPFAKWTRDDASSTH